MAWAQIQNLDAAAMPIQRYLPPTLLALTGEVARTLSRQHAPPSSEQAPNAPISHAGLAQIVVVSQALGESGNKV